MRQERKPKKTFSCDEELCSFFDFEGLMPLLALVVKYREVPWQDLAISKSPRMGPERGRTYRYQKHTGLLDPEAETKLFVWNI